MIVGDGGWFLEVYAPEGLQRDEITVRQAESSVPAAFTASVDAEYYETLREKTARTDNAVIEHDGMRYPATVDDETIVLGDDPLEAGDWGDRPTLYEATADGLTKRFWDGSTFVARPNVTENGLELCGFEGSYAERLPASDAIEEYDIADLPLSMNISIAPIVAYEGDDAVPVFYRSDEVAEYPNYHHVVAGGIDGLDEHPVDAGWRELDEEIGLTQGTGEYQTDAPLEVLGIGRNTETHAPELLGVLETDLPYEDVAAHVSDSPEHADVQPVPVTELDSFVTETDDVIPIGAANLLLVADHYDECDITESQRDLSDTPYAGFETQVVQG